MDGWMEGREGGREGWMDGWMEGGRERGRRERKGGRREQGMETWRYNASILLAYRIHLKRYRYTGALS